MPYSPFRMRLAAVELSRAVYELSREVNRMTAIARLKKKLNRASGVAQRAIEAIEAEADALIAEEDVLKAQTEEAFSPHKAVIAEAKTEVQAIKDSLNLMSNGGPALNDAEPTESADDPVSKYPVLGNY